MVKDARKDIEDAISTLFSAKLGSYGLDHGFLKTETHKRIQRDLLTLDEKTKKELEPRIYSRVEKALEFVRLPQAKQSEVLKIAAQHHIPVEKAYYDLTGSVQK